VDDYVYVFWEEITACYCNSGWRVWFCEEGAVDLALCQRERRANRVVGS
jgi:hypothetical protein